MIEIRRARVEDCQSISDVHTGSVKAIQTDLYTPDELAAWAVPKPIEKYEEFVLTKEFYVAEEDGQILAFGVLNAMTAEIEAIYVSPEAGGRGLGLEVIRTMEERARALGLTQVSLNASLNAVPFYRRAGFIERPPSRYRLSTGLEIACIPMVKIVAS